MTLHPYSDTMVSLLLFSSPQFSFVINTGWFKWSQLYAFCPLVAHWQSFEQCLQNESQLEVKISMKAKKRTMSKSFFPCFAISCLKIVKTVLRYIPFWLGQQCVSSYLLIRAWNHHQLEIVNIAMRNNFVLDLVNSILTSFGWYGVKDILFE